MLLIDLEGVLEKILWISWRNPSKGPCMKVSQCFAEAMSYAVLARSTFASEKAQYTSRSEHF
jgi:hypothetical protein